MSLATAQYRSGGTPNSNFKACRQDAALDKGVPVPVDSSQVTFGAEKPADWDLSDEGDVDDALDQLAKRLKWTVTAIKTSAYTANNRELVRVDPS